VVNGKGSGEGSGECNDEKWENPNRKMLNMKEGGAVEKKKELKDHVVHGERV